MTRIQVRTFGGLTVYCHDVPVIIPWNGRKPRRLFTYLAIASHRWVHRDHFCELFWPGESAKTVATNFSVCLSQLRRGFTEVTAVEPVLTQGKAYRLNFEEITCDCDLFRAHAVEGIKLLASGEQTAALPLLTEALDRYWAYFLPEEPHDRFINAIRQELANLAENVRNGLKSVSGV